MFFLKYVKYYAAWVAYFVVARALFLAYNWEQTQTIGFQNFMKTFTHGIRLDLSAAAYFSVLPFLVFSFFELWKKPPHIAVRLAQIYTFLFLILSSVLVTVDLELYGNWGFRIDDTFLKYLASPTEMTATVSSYPYVKLFVLFLMLCFSAIYVFNKILLQNALDTEGLQKPKIGRRILHFVVGWLLTVSLIIPIRGGFQLAPVNQSAVYFSNNTFQNHTAVNAIWNFMISTFEHTSEDRNPYEFFPEAEADAIVAQLFLDSSKNKNVLRQDIKQPNIIIITYESLTAKVIERLGGERGITPNFDSLTHEGLLFSNIYATGDRTDKGLVGVLSGQPALPRVNIMEVPRKSAQLPILSKILRGQNYATGFYYGGEAEFANMKSYLLNGQFSTLITKENFEKKDLSSKWGAFDHVVLSKLINDSYSFKKPFFVNLLTLSSHEPFEIPEGFGKPNMPATTDVDELFRRVHYYSDQALGAFIGAAKQQSWWNNTLIIVIADHSTPRLSPHDDQFARFHIPMLWLGGALAVRDSVVETIGSQTDLAATLLGQLHLPSRPNRRSRTDAKEDADKPNFDWSKNLLTENPPQFAYFAFHEGFGFVQKTGKYAFDTEGSIVTQKDGAVDTTDIRKGKAYLQTTYHDFLKK